ncbi:hypothetical protein LI165_13360, partial [Phascolarctobacterium faecium]|uniref:hypothetical protein n=1 Tax=Phascolarctobacterium faecium TaxID=33025 RepID=UPI001D0937CD
PDKKRYTLDIVGFFTTFAQVGHQNSKMKADWFTIIEKCACNKQKNENEGEKCYHAFAVMKWNRFKKLEGTPIGNLG